ncbi:MAG: 50S ribosomal protein L25 [Anaerolineae bacterium]
MEQVTLKAEPRATGRHANRELRNAERVPAVVYGKTLEALPISVDRKSLGIALHAAGGRTIQLEMPGQAPIHVLPREIQRHPVRHAILHVDFQAISMTEKVHVLVPVVTEGEAPVLANPEMILVRNLDTVEVECLPGDIPEHVVADLSRLTTADDEVLVKDLVVPPRVHVLTKANHVVFSVAISRAGLVEEAAAAEAPAADEVEVVSKRKPKEEVEE